MQSTEILPGLILGLREGLEAFLVIGIIIDYLRKTGNARFLNAVRFGMGTGIVGSALIGFGLWALSGLLGNLGGATGKIWESAASMVGLVLVSGFIVWMMRHGASIQREVEGEVDTHLSSAGLFLVAFVMVLREGAEIGLFAFSSIDKNVYLIGIGIGVAAAAIIAYLISKALIRVDLKALFTVTLGYLVLQAGYLLGYGVHEGLSSLKALGALPADHPLLVKAFDLSGGILDHKTGAIGLPLNVLIGWYSKPEWLQAFLQTGYVAALTVAWSRIRARMPASGK